MKVIEVYNPDETIEISGRTYPASCLLEDDDAIRIAVFPSLLRMSAHWWARAHADGARMLVAPAFSGWVFLTVERFMEVRQEHAATSEYLCNEGFSLGQDAPSYRQALAILKQEAKVRSDLPHTSLPDGFVHLHAHSEYSALDGLSTVEEMVTEVVRNGDPAMALADHGRCAGHPKLQAVCKKAGIKPIFAIEANFTDDRFLRGTPGAKFLNDEQLSDALRRGMEVPTPEEMAVSGKFVLNDYRHLILIAENDVGLRNIWAASTEANRTGFYGRPRLDWDVLERYSEGVLCSTACLRGPLAQAILKEDEEKANTILARLLGIFPDRLWMELHTNQMPEQHIVNSAIADMAARHGLPTVAVVDSHYPCPEDKLLHRIWIAAQTDKELTDDADLFAGDHDYHLMHQDEVRACLGNHLDRSVVEESIQQTWEIANRCTASIHGRAVMPVYSKPQDKGLSDEEMVKLGKQRDVERVVDLCMEAWKKKCVGKAHSEDEYIARFEREMKLLIDKGFCGYYLMVWDQVSHAKRNRILVGPGRGSGAGSLVSYLLGITEIDPLEYGLMFERFLTEGRDSPPDFDVDYPSTKRHFMQDYCVERWGADYVMRVGTHQRFKNKGIIRKLASVLKESIPNIHFPDFDAISKIIDVAESGTAGAGMKWEDLLDEYSEELGPFIAKYPELFETAERLVKRLSSYGRHAAGMVITTDEPLSDRYPMRASEDKDATQMISEFDMKALEDLGLLKFDLLTLRTLDTLQMCLDLIEEHYGTQINVYEWDEEYRDPQVWGEIMDGHTMGLFQVETKGVTKLTKRFQPRSIADLADVITLVRPGPTRSGLTESYFRRRSGNEPVSYPDPRLEKALKSTYGIIAYQEQVMAVCQLLCGYTLAEADEVRRLMGKKEVEKVQAAGHDFTTRGVANGMDQQVAFDLWEKLGEFAKYSFNLSHAVSYAVIGYWTAWFKFHYPSMFLTAVLSTVDGKRVPEFVNEARRMGYQVLPPDINQSHKGFRPVGGTTVRYGFVAVSDISDAVADAIIQGQPYTSFEDFLERKGKAAHSGVVKKLVKIGAFDTLVENRRALEESLDWADDPDSTRCVNKDETVVLPHGLPCTFDWEGEPVELTAKGKEKKRKPPPKKCTRACRNYTPPSERDFTTVEPYNDHDIRERERELLGIYLSSTPFDRIHDDDLEQLSKASEVEIGPPGEYMVAAIITKVRKHNDRTGAEMAFLGVDAQDGTLDVTVFKDQWKQFRECIALDHLVLASVIKNDRGLNLRSLMPL